MLNPDFSFQLKHPSGMRMNQAFSGEAATAICLSRPGLGEQAKGFLKTEGMESTKRKNNKRKKFLTARGNTVPLPPKFPECLIVEENIMTLSEGLKRVYRNYFKAPYYK